MQSYYNEAEVLPQAVVDAAQVEGATQAYPAVVGRDPCFRCGSLQHLVADCPVPPGKGKGKPVPGAAGHGGRGRSKGQNKGRGKSPVRQWSSKGKKGGGKKKGLKVLHFNIFFLLSLVQMPLVTCLRLWCLKHSPSPPSPPSLIPSFRQSDFFLQSLKGWLWSLLV